MKTFATITVAALLALSSVPASAQDMAVKNTAVHDWSGISIGKLIAIGTGGTDYSLDFAEDLAPSALLGGVISINGQSGNIVYGAELSALFGSLSEVGYIDEYFFHSIFDAKGRAGIASGDALFYLDGGFSVAGFEGDGFPATLTGLNLGGGIDFAVSEQLTLGAAYSHRWLSGEFASVPPQDMDAQVGTFTVRALWNLDAR